MGTITDTSAGVALPKPYTSPDRKGLPDEGGITLLLDRAKEGIQIEVYDRARGGEHAALSFLLRGLLPGRRLDLCGDQHQELFPILFRFAYARAEMRSPRIFKNARPHRKECVL